MGAVGSGRSSVSSGTSSPGDSVAGVSGWQLLHRYLDRRDEVAFEAIVTRHGPMVLGVCRRVLADARDVEDAFQATFLVLARKGGTPRRGRPGRPLALRGRLPGRPPGPGLGRPSPDGSNGRRAPAEAASGRRPRPTRAGPR